MNKTTPFELAAWALSGVLAIATLVLGALAAASSTTVSGIVDTTGLSIAVGALAPVLAAALVLSGVRVLLEKNRA
ncbi:MULTISPECIES: hypothetical protein [unclassified Microbacterium]|uniref:hypothetical protein n=1 Tax=unclassified Microbacterium TaxID=2609290 RepID=UPI000CFA9FAF|nr:MULTISPECIES: hypothetical protein [unclassified Microbacterium]PQZ60691.1 hypothetical protein CQ032_04085 [Microbacterium sp. MYb43]PQZ82117.1 hypothetical protein CQ031_01485 [Microbacterium sp. MYb40]PRB22953.1 hypothetical protein CQ037_18120 [Microbacterium sp. MYb50]PRB24183.1 hypothetical protein CQ040_02745 [Microbacterium sp. MYb54]PRB69667.1 hypothetical protein CQ021_02750 [Microbacterium sp. MYb24]